MPKKKPIDKRLKNLFEDITPEQPPLETKPTSGKGAVPADAAPRPRGDLLLESPGRRRQLAAVSTASSSSAMSLAFQMGQNNWATFQVMDEAEQRQWSQDEQLLVKQVADQLSLALENAQLFQETQSRAEGTGCAQ